MKLVCKMKCSYGAKGEVVDVKAIKKADDLSDRQKVMLAVYKEPKVKEVEGK